LQGMELLKAKKHVARRWHDGREDTSMTIGSRTWDRLTSILAALGSPPEATIRGTTLGSSSGKSPFQHFMSRNEARMGSDSDVWKRVFYETKTSKVRLLVFYRVSNVLMRARIVCRGCFRHATETRQGGCCRSRVSGLPHSSG
jgi:hypothetical protein